MDTDLEKKEYEISFLVDSADADAEVTNVLAKIKAEITIKKPVSEIHLAYPIKKHSSAFFGFIRFKALSGDVAELKASLQLNTKVLRFLNIAYIPVKPRANRGKKVERVEDKAEGKTQESSVGSVVARGRAMGQASGQASPKGGQAGAVSNEELEKTLEEILK